MTRITLTRRHFALGAAALLAAPARAQAASWGTIVDQLRQEDQAHALLVLQDGQVALRERFRGPALSRFVPIKSVSKSVVAALLGAALDRGEVADVTQTIAGLAPRLIPASAAEAVDTITLADLVTMQAGLERTSGANYGEWVSSRNWVANALSRPMVARPGAGMLYSTGSFHILGAVLAEVTGKSLLAQARERLGAPLGIEIPAWVRDPQGYYLGGNEMALTIDAMAAFGELYRRRGQVGDAQVLSQRWVRASFQAHTRSFFSGLSYGYGWFLGRGGGVQYALARGYGGQIICVAPDLALTVVITSDPTRPARSAGYFGDLQRLIENTILPLARQQMG
ncbi:MAG: serine hydrolase [Pseudomonadota bacterium]